jgi:hypothetical protein
MATFAWEVYSDTPGWKDVGANTFIFAGSASDLTTPITVGEWQTGTHIGNGDPGTDQCGTNHVRNVKYISSTQFDSGGGTETLNDTNLVATECTLRVKFTDASAVATSSARFYSFDSSVVTNEAIGIHAYAFERGVSATTWTQINDDSGNIGGDNTGERLGLSDQTANTEHYFYIAVSCQAESVGAKTQFDFGLALTYS